MRTTQAVGLAQRRPPTSLFQYEAAVAPSAVSAGVVA